MALASCSGYDRLKKQWLEMENEAEFEEKTPEFVLNPNFDVLKIPFDMPPVANVKNFITQHFGQSDSKLHFAKGTTTLSFIYEGATKDDKGGIMVAADSRASGGTYISSKTITKILDITKFIVGTMAGGAADCQYWVALLGKQCRLYELQNNERISVAAASKMMANMVYYYRGKGLSIGTMIAGFDKRGPAICYVDTDGNRCKGTKFSVGSGQMNAYAVLDTFYKPKMTDEEAADLARKAIMHATYRDSGSGGTCKLVHVTKDGVKRFEPVDVSEMYYEFMNEKQRDFHEPQQL